MERLQKVMAHAGVASRRKCEQYILDGRVRVNKKVIKELGYKVNSSDIIEVDGVQLYKEAPVYILFNKPRGVITSVSDEKNRVTVLDYMNEVNERIYPIGRLDYDTTGLLLLTNDGDFAQMLMHPKYHVDKTYVATVDGVPTNQQLNKLRRGVVIDGKKTSPAQAQILTVDAKKGIAQVELIIHEGWNHQVKNMLKAVGLPIRKLKRTHYSFLNVDQLPIGKYRPLKMHEVRRLKQEAITQKGKQNG